MKQKFLDLKFYCWQLKIKTFGDLQAYKQKNNIFTLNQTLLQMIKDFNGNYYNTL